ncbi:MAG: acetate kinase [Actinomycetota bacterium]
MTTTVLVLNSGSSSVKWAVIDADRGTRVAAGAVDQIGETGSATPDHAAAIAVILAELPAGRIDAVGHRIVHGGMRFSEAVLIDDAVIAAVQQLVPLAPLHNPAGLEGIQAARAALPGIPQVAVFDTAFHATLPPAAYTYAIDTHVAQRFGVRRYGFHGTSYRFVSRVAADFLGRPLDELRLVVLHLGNGASAAAIAGGVSVDTSMGLTPLEGLVMGTRSGDIDPAVIPYLSRVAGMSVDDIDDLLNRRSGLLGLAGHGDLRETVSASERGSAHAALAIEVYVHRLRHYIGAYAAIMGGVDAIVFTGGVGENSALIRSGALETFGFLGVHIDPEANAAVDQNRRAISSSDSTVAVLVIPTDEELEIVRQVADVIG